MLVQLINYPGYSAPSTLMMNGASSTANVETDAALQQLSTRTTNTETDLKLNIGNNTSVSGKQLVNHLNDLNSLCTKISTELCKGTGKASVTSISADDFKKCGKLQKKVLGDYLLSLISQCSNVCRETDLKTLPRSQTEIQMDIILPEISECIQRNIEKQAEWQHSQFQGMQEQLSRLQSYSDSLATDQHQDYDKQFGSTSINYIDSLHI